MKKRNITIMDIYHTCYSLSPDIRVDVYSATKGALPLWSGELQAAPVCTVKQSLTICLFSRTAPRSTN